MNRHEREFCRESDKKWTESMQVKQCTPRYNNSSNTDTNKTWTWDDGQRPWIRAVEINYLRGACGVNRIDSESNESVHDKLGASSKGEERSCCVESETQHTGRNEMTKRIYKGRVDAVAAKGRSRMREQSIRVFQREGVNERITGVECVNVWTEASANCSIMATPLRQCPLTGVRINR